MAAGLGSLFFLRPYFIGFSVAAFAWGFIGNFRKRLRIGRRGGLPGILASLAPRTVCDAYLYLGVLVVSAIIMLPPWSLTYFLAPGNLRSVRRNEKYGEAVEKRRKIIPNPCALRARPATPNPCAI